MKRALRYLTKSLVILSVLIFCPAFDFETEAQLLPRVEILVPGVTRTIEITQDNKPPQDFSQLLRVALGYGPLTITLYQNEPTEGGFLVLTGMAISSAGVMPVFKFGAAQVMLMASVEIGDERSPYGLLWISSWINSSLEDPPYIYSLQLSF